MPATILGVDAVYDLAVLRTSRPHKGFLKLAAVQVQQGTRLYSLGHPRDLGLTIVEGTYNGLLQHTLYPKILFSGWNKSGYERRADGDARRIGGRHRCQHPRRTTRVSRASGARYGHCWNER